MKRTTNGHEERRTRDMMDTPVTDLARLIGQKWYLPLDDLAKEAGVRPRFVTQAVRGKAIGSYVEQKIRDVLESL